MRNDIGFCSIRVLVLMGALLLGSGCATSRGAIALDIPVESSPVAVQNKSIAIRSVKDQRVFENDPRDPAIPSLGFGGIDQVSLEERKRAIARKRNSYGKALGDVFLENGNTVELLVSDMLKSVLRELGYTIVDRNQVRSDTLVMDVTIEKFWAWFTPGFWAITLRSDIATTINVGQASSGMRQQKKITIHEENSGQAATTGAWKAIFLKALASYKENAKSQLSELK